MSSPDAPTLAQRVVRYRDLRPCTNAFVDTRSPGSDKKENFTIIGPGVSENPQQYVHIPEPHGFNIGGARQPPGCLNSQHSHDTAEVFIVHKGTWRFTWGVNADDGAVDLREGDTISIPTHMFRGFENVGDEVGFLFAVLGGDDPGKVVWSPQVFAMARDYGLVLLEGGRLIDTTVGETVPDDAKRQQAPSHATIASLASPTAKAMASCVVRLAELSANPASPLAAPGVEECGVITPKVTGDRFPPGPIVGWWPHGFNLRCLKLTQATGLPEHSRAEEEVYLLHRGTWRFTVDGETVELAGGDIITVPKGAARKVANLGAETAIAFVVRGGDRPALPSLSDQREAAA